MIQISNLIFNTIPTKFHHLFCFSILEPRKVEYHIFFRDIRAKHNRSILHLQFYSDKISSFFPLGTSGQSIIHLFYTFNLSNLGYHSGSLSNEKSITQLSSLRQLDIFNQIWAKFHNLLSFSKFEHRWFKYHILLQRHLYTIQSIYSYIL